MKYSPQSYQQALAEMFGLGRFGIKLGVETITAMLLGVGRPQEKFKSIHIAGTNGKGSVAATLSSVLQAAGYKVGVYTSPHLIDVNERFCINGLPVSHEDVFDAYHAVKQVREVPRQPTFFEFTTAMAWYLFAKHGVDWAVVETGMGGRLDATNVLAPALSVITNISLEHKAYLGGTIGKIAGEKAGIIKQGTPVVTGVTQKSALAAVEKAAREKGAAVYLNGRDFSVRRHKDNTFDYNGMGWQIKNLSTRLPGVHQSRNAALALAALEIITKKGEAAIDEDALRRGLARVNWPGRLELVDGPVPILLDGAHNLDAMRCLARHIKREKLDGRLVVVAGFLDDKPYEAMMPMLLSGARAAVITHAKIDRAVDAGTLLPHAKKIVPEAVSAPGVEAALEKALALARPGMDTILVAGSLYIVGEARKALIKKGLLSASFALGRD